METLITEEPKKKSYDFVDHIRAIAMIAIVAEHSFSSPATKGTFIYWVSVGLTQVTKFGTISFFLLAGFLIGEKFTDYTPGQYLKRRFANTFGPWLFWSAAFVLWFVLHMALHAIKFPEDPMTFGPIADLIEMTYLYSNYWFIINFMISITILLIFKRQLYHLGFGAALLAFTLFYSINVHYEWINAAHTTAILGFVFFLWLGAQLRKYWHVIDVKLKNIPYTLIIALVLLAYALTMYEGYTLYKANSIHIFNTLRLSNILYSLLVFTLLLKIRTFRKLDYLKPRDTTFGIYLIHAIILVYVTKEILRPFHINTDTLSLMPFIGYQLLYFIVTYSLTFLIVKLIGMTKAKGLIGN